MVNKQGLLAALAVAVALCGHSTIEAFAPVANNPSARIASRVVVPGVTSTPSLLKPSSSTVRFSSAAATAENEGQGGGTATIPNEITNLVKNIVGAGVLSLPAGIAAFGNAPSAVVPAVALIAIIGVLSGYCFALIGRVCAMTGATSYREAWSNTVSPATSWIPAASCTFKTSVAVLAYSMILSDTSSSLLATAGVAATRNQCLLGVTSLILLPLCLLKNLSSLAPFSLLGSLGMVYTTIAMAIRYFGGAYKAPAGKLLSSVSTPGYLPSFGAKGATSVLTPKAFILIGMLSTAFMAHFNAPKFYVELKNNTIERYNKVVGLSFAISIALFSAITALGYLTFGGASAGLILNNYANADSLMSFSRIAVFVSIVFSYPLSFVGVRDGVLDLLNVKERPNSLLNTLTLGLLSLVTLGALKVKDVSFVLAFGGATLGNALIYVYPVLMFREAVKQLKEPTKAIQREVKLAMGLVALGIGMGFTGAKMAIASLGK